MDLPGQAGCCWVESAPKTRYRTLLHSGRTEVAVVGAGIVGLTVAYLLAREGVTVTVLEALRVGAQVTGRSTAKITSQHTLIYAYLIRSFGRAIARLYADANQDAIRHIRQSIADARIACELEDKDAFAYTTRRTRAAAIEKEAEAARSLGLDADVVGAAPLPFATAAALRFRGQAQFNPAQYLVGVASAVKADGGAIYENTRVETIERHGKGWRIGVGRHGLEAQSVVIATNLPIASPLPFDEMTRPRCHIAMAFRCTPAQSIDGMFIDIDRPTHSLRMGRDADGPLLIALGPKFPTGHDGDVIRRFRELEGWVREHLPAGPVAWHWVNEDYDSPDRVPLAGALGRKAPGMYVATGFSGWGISNGTAAGITIADLIRGRPNPAATLYDPTRALTRKFNSGGETRSLKRDIDAIPAGEGGVIVHGRKKLAVWKSADGKPHALDAACTHLGCTVTWNNAEQTWDCPCHGSMFTRDGAVIHGPATKPLPPRRRLGPRAR